MGTQDQIDLINVELARLDTIINGLNGTEAWEVVLQDSKRQAIELDSRWCYIKTLEDLTEMRVTKMAVMYVIGLMDNCMAQRDSLLNAKLGLQSPDSVITKDVDN